MRSSIMGLDRVSLAVENLEAARKSFEALGFSLSSRSRHVGRGTGNYRILMPGVAGNGVYIELLAQIDAHEQDDLLQTRLQGPGEGLLSLGLKTEHAEGAQGDLADDLAGGDVFQAFGSVDKDGVAQMASFNLLTLLEAHKSRPAMAAVEHGSRDLIYQDKWMSHANGALAIREIHVRSDSVNEDVAATQPFFTPAQNEAQDRQVDALMDGERVARMTFLSDPAWDELYGEAADGTAGLVIECANAIETKAHLEAAGVEVEFVNSRLNGYRVPLDQTHGIWLTFVSA